MQKFMDGEEPLCDRDNVVVMVDEAHRGQYGLTEKMDAEGNVSIGAAMLVRKALPNASYIGFYWHAKSQQRTRIPARYLVITSTYNDMIQAVEDNADTPSLLRKSRCCAASRQERT